MKHKGKIFEKAIRNSHLPITKIAQLAGYSSRNMYNLFEKEHLPFSLFVKVGKIIGYDFAEDLPEITKFLMINEPEGVYQLESKYKEKYFDLLEKHLALKEEFDEFKSNIQPVLYKKTPIKRVINKKTE